MELSNGVSIPAIGLGVYKMQAGSEMNAAVKAAYRAGYRLFDTAQMYGNEAALGEALRRKGAVLRSCGNYPGLDASWYRTAVRTENENRQLLALLAETLPEVAQ